MPESRLPLVVLGLPSSAEWKRQTAVDIASLANRAGRVCNLLICSVGGLDTSVARTAVVDTAIIQSADWILWIDSDMSFPAQALEMLLAHDLDIVGADYRRRMPPYAPIGMAINPVDPMGMPLSTDGNVPMPETGLAEMAVLGFGVLLTRMAVFRKVPRPWFYRLWNPKDGTPGNPDGFTTEDTVFCHIARSLGFRVWCDYELSAKVMHIGEMMVPWNLRGKKSGQN